MDKDLNYYYKTCDFIYRNPKERMQRCINNEYGYNFDSNKRRVITNEFNKTTTHINKDFINNNKIR